ncbi:hypothetical protein V5F44_03750 [Xanthobacter sp. V2C-8]|uniref:hypothetical protein n=1 Tax=Xanthobacter albus TaxID=3119929 RepID=UPI00372B9164
MLSPASRAALAAALLAASALGVMIPSARAFEPSPGPAWPDSIPARLAALALLESLNADLLSHPSATLTLDRWCATHRLAPEGTRIVAERVPGAEKPADDAVRQALQAGPQERIAYRRVRLRCGEKVLSEADNWYLPALLTPEMNHRLETTDTAFGRVVQPLDFRRRTLSATLLWRPLPEGWEMGAAVPSAAGARLDPPAHVLEHRAVLTLPDGTPFSALVESYTRGVLDFPWPVLP